MIDVLHCRQQQGCSNAMELSVPIYPRYRFRCQLASPCTNSRSCSASIFARPAIDNKAARVFALARREESLQNISRGRNGFQNDQFTSRSHVTPEAIAVESSSPSEAEFQSQREMHPCLPFQTLETFPREKLLGKVVMVRFDSKLCPIEDQVVTKCPSQSALNTLKYLCNAGTRVVLASHFLALRNSAKVLQTQLVADYLSVCLERKVIAAPGVIGDTVEDQIDKLENGDILLLGDLSQYREEAANCMDFARRLSTRIDILVNDTFSESHRVLASTVGVARFTYARIAGFHLAEKFSLFAGTLERPKRPFIAIIGGAKLLEKTSALRSLLCKCDKIAFVGAMAFTFLYALGLPISPSLVEKHALGEALELLDIAKQKNVIVLLPKDFWCINDVCACEQMHVFKTQYIMNGWRPVDIGPTTMNEIASLLVKCKMAFWIGPVKLGESKQQCCGSSNLARLLGQVSKSGCTTIVVGKEACNSVREAPVTCSFHHIFEHGAVVWELLKGNTLAGVAALDHAYLGTHDWTTIFGDPSQPLVVDIGSGNGLFVLKMAQRFKHLNFLGLEINRKLVDHSIASVQELEVVNGYFILTNATTTFRSIISNYPGSLLLVSIQCPNPDFSDPKQRWRMVQRSLVEAIVDMICGEGKVFLQSDVKEVAVRMKNEFLQYGEGKVTRSIEHSNSRLCDAEGWLMDNPFGVFSDWEQHVIDRGEPMYRVMLSKHTDSDRARTDECSWKKSVALSNILRLC